LSRPFPFENRPATTDTTRRAARDYLLAELAWPEARQRLAEVDLALLPVGAIEQHGPHLPLDTDAFDAQLLAQRVAEACSEPRPLVLPLLPYGVSYHHEDFPGTIGISHHALAAMVHDIGLACARHGITKLVIVNGHGGNTPTLQFAAQMINRDAHIFTTVDSGETSDVDLDALCTTRNDVHAGFVETSTSLASRPELVRMERAEAFVPEFSSRYLNFSARRSVEWYARTLSLSASGVLGDPTKASAETGHAMWEVMVRNLTELVEELKALSLEEIYERRY
jgi:creatinine amidohydrolase/Fe(II)-dependent formamide hydrolase-like protein